MWVAHSHSTACLSSAFHRDSFAGSAPSSGTSEDAWLWEAPEDVDVAVAVRDFAKAASLIARARRHLAQLLPSDSLSDHQHPQQTQVSAAAIGLTKLRDRVEARATNLSTVLQEELTRAADRHSKLLCSLYYLTAPLQLNSVSNWDGIFLSTIKTIFAELSTHKYHWEFRSSCQGSAVFTGNQIRKRVCYGGCRRVTTSTTETCLP